MGMTERQKIIPEDRIRSGRRLAVDIDAPRDRTVCFMVSEDERLAIDELAACLSRTRSAVLTKIVNAFIADWNDGDDPERIRALFQEYRAPMKKNQIPPHRK
jgi:hypothetical protein